MIVKCIPEESSPKRNCQENNNIKMPWNGIWSYVQFLGIGLRWFAFFLFVCRSGPPPAPPISQYSERGLHQGREVPVGSPREGSWWSSEPGAWGHAAGGQLWASKGADPGQLCPACC